VVVGVQTKNVGEGTRKGGCGLDGRKHVFSNVVGHIESKNAFCLIGGDTFLDFYDVLVEMTDVVGIPKYKSLFHVETYSNDILGVFET